MPWEPCDLETLVAAFEAADRTLSRRTIAQLVVEILLALEYFRLAGIVHRDLHTGNVLISWKGHVKVTTLSSSMYR